MTTRIVEATSVVRSALMAAVATNHRGCGLLSAVCCRRSGCRRADVQGAAGHQADLRQRLDLQPRSAHEHEQDAGQEDGPGDVSPTATASSGPRISQPRSMALWLDTGPGNASQSVSPASNGSGFTQPRSATISSRSSARCAWGPPKPSVPVCSNRPMMARYGTGP